jgi:hypothetical protein
MAPKRQRQLTRTPSTGANSQQPLPKGNLQIVAFLARSIFIVLIIVKVIGIPIVIKNEGEFPFDALRYRSDELRLSAEAEQRQLSSNDMLYYKKLQSVLNMSNKDMFVYLQQWIYTVPPDDPHNYATALHEFEHGNSYYL